MLTFGQDAIFSLIFCLQNPGEKHCPTTLLKYTSWMLILFFFSPKAKLFLF